MRPIQHEIFALPVLADVSEEQEFGRVRREFGVTGANAAEREAEAADAEPQSAGL